MQKIIHTKIEIPDRNVHLTREKLKKAIDEVYDLIDKKGIVERMVVDLNGLEIYLIEVSP